MSFVLLLPRKMHLCRFSSNVPCLPSILEMPQNNHVVLTFEEVHNPVRLPGETTSEPPKAARTCGILYILTWKRASRHNGVHFFDLSTSKSGPTMVCFTHFDFEMYSSIMFEHKIVQNGTILRDVFIFWTWQHPKRSNSARIPHFSKCKTSKTKNSARRPSKMESWVQSWQPRTNAFCDFSSPPV